MSGYVESNLGKNEVIVKKADRTRLFLLSAWIKGILLCFLLFIPTVKAIIATVKFDYDELALTNKRVIGKVGVMNTATLDAPLSKIQNVGVTQSFGGKVFNYSTVEITTAAGMFKFGAVKNGNEFKSMIMAQIDQFENDRISQQANQMAQAMSSAIRK